MKTYTLVATESNNKIKLHRENDGFSALELLGMLEALKKDIYSQMDSTSGNVSHDRIIVKHSTKINTIPILIAVGTVAACYFSSKNKSVTNVYNSGKDE